MQRVNFERIKNNLIDNLSCQNYELMELKVKNQVADPINVTGVVSTKNIVSTFVFNKTVFLEQVLSKY